MQKARKYFKRAAVLYLILIILIYLGSFLINFLKSSWYATGSVITVIFIWVTIFTVATIIAAKGIDVLKQGLQGKERLDFVAKLGTLIAEYKISQQEINIPEFFEQVCRENGVMEAPDLNKYMDENKDLPWDRDAVFDKIRQEIESAAEEHSEDAVS